MLLTHARLAEDGFVLRRLCFDAPSRATCRIVVALVWRRRWDRRSEVRRLAVSRAQAQLSLLGLGDMSAR